MSPFLSSLPTGVNMGAYRNFFCSILKKGNKKWFYVSAFDHYENEFVSPCVRKQVWFLIQLNICICM